jgi:predicted thioesterase
MPDQPLAAGLEAVAEHVVEPSDTAAALGSGDLDVLATPRLLAWLEGATCAVVAERLSDDETSVGTRVNLEHVAASGLGSPVTVRATLVHVDGRLLRFEAVALDAAERMIARAEITRVVVDRARFLARL